MEISLLKSLFNSISSFFQLPSCEGVKCEPVEKYHQRIEERLKLLKPILDAIVDGEIATDEMLQKLAGLHQSFDELREILEKAHPLMSKVYFVLRVESLMKKIETYCLDIPELLKSSDQFLAAKLNAASLEHCVWKLKYSGHEQTSSAIMKAIEDHVDGYEASSEGLAVISDSLSLKTSQELLIEAVALEKLKEIAEHAENSGEVEYFNHLIALVTHMHKHLLTTKLSQTCNSVSVPAYFYCPLSLELMVDPVIVASGQTYERAFIQKWIDLGLTVCPTTRQPLAHTTLTPNSIVKGLIAKWHESDNMKVPAAENYFGVRRANHSIIPDLTDSLSSPGKSLPPFKIPQAGLSTSHPRSLSEGSLPRAAVNGKSTLDPEGISKESGEEISDHSGERSLNSGDELSTSSYGVDTQASYGRNQTNIAAFTPSNSSVSQGTCGDGNEVASKAAACPSDASGELMLETQPAASSRSPLREPGLASPLETASQGQAVGLEASERSVPSLVSTPAVPLGAEPLEVENHVRSLVDDLTSTSIDTQRNATAGLRLLAKHDKDNRIIIANCGAISLLVNLLHSTDSEVQENAVTALLNLSINARNKTAIANVDAIEPLIHVLETGSEEAKQNSAATLYSLSEIEENKIKIGRSKAIKPLVELLGNGTPGGQKDALKALFILSKFQENQIRIVQAGAVKYLIELIDPAAGMVDKAVALLSNLATTFEGRARIGQDGGIPVLVEVIELGAARDKENAAAALLQLCTKSGRYCKMALLEGIIPPLVALTTSGTSRAKEKARALLNYLRNQRHSH